MKKIIVCLLSILIFTGFAILPIAKAETSAYPEDTGYYTVSDTTNTVSDTTNTVSDTTNTVSDTNTDTSLVIDSSYASESEDLSYSSLISESEDLTSSSYSSYSEGLNSSIIEEPELGEFKILYDANKAALLGGTPFTLKTENSSGEIMWLTNNESVMTVSNYPFGDYYLDFEIPETDFDLTVGYCYIFGSGVSVVKAFDLDRYAYAYIQIIDATSVSGDAEAKINVNAFNKVGEDLVFTCVIGGYSSFYNFVGEWDIRCNGESVEFIVEDNKATVKKAPLGKYTASLTSICFPKIECNAEVSNVNAEIVWVTLLPVASVIMLVLLAVLILVRIREDVFSRQERLLNKMSLQLDKTILKLSAENITFKHKQFSRSLVELRVKFRSCANEIEIINLDNFGQFLVVQNTYNEAIKCLTAAAEFENFTPDSAVKFIKVFKRRFVEKLIADMPVFKAEFHNKPVERVDSNPVYEMNAKAEVKLKFKRKRKKSNKDEILSEFLQNNSNEGENE